jgi:hypothetical protein
MKMEICSQVDPVMVVVEPEHTVRCHLFDGSDATERND